MFVEDIERLRLEVSDRDKQIHALETAKDAVHSELRLSKSAQQQAEEALAAAGAEIAALKTQLTGAKARHAEIQVLEERLAQAETNLAAAESQAEKMTNVAAIHEEAIAGLSDELSVANARVSQQDAELETTREIMQALHERSFLDTLISKGVASLTRTKTPA
jgi:chromosome segregation ATPase